MKKIFIIQIIIIIILYYSYSLLFVNKPLKNYELIKVNRINKIVYIKLRKLNKNINTNLNKFNRIYHVKFKKIKKKNKKILTKTQNNLEIIIITKWDLLLFLLDILDYN